MILTLLMSVSLKGYAQDNAKSFAPGDVLELDEMGLLCLRGTGMEGDLESKDGSSLWIAEEVETRNEVKEETRDEVKEEAPDKEVVAADDDDDYWQDIHFPSIIPPKGDPKCPICTSSVVLKTNGLYDALLVPNLGIEFSFGNHWSIGLDYVGAWWSSDKHHRYWQCYGGYLTLKRYFSDFHQLRRGEGKGTHHVGIYLTGLTYDVEWGGKGYQAARMGFGGGVEYGYSLPIGKRLNLDFSIGVGFQDGEYKEYDPQDDHYVWQATKKRHWFGPTKAEISLVWLLWKGGGR